MWREAASAVTLPFFWIGLWERKLVCKGESSDPSDSNCSSNHWTERSFLLYPSLVTPDMGVCSATSHLSKYIPFIAFAAITKLTFVIFPGSYPACAKVYFANVPKRLTGRSSGDRSVSGARLQVESHTAQVPRIKKLLHCAV